MGKNLTYISQLEGLDFKLYQACPPAQHAFDLVAGAGIAANTEYASVDMAGCFKLV